MFRTTITVALLSLALAGCTGSNDPSESSTNQPADDAVDLRFAYSGVSDEGTIDQTLTITNTSRTLSAAPTLSFVALDSDSEPMTDVSVTTVFGSDRGLVVAPANYEVLDILRFEGPGSGDVEDVEVTVEGMRTAEDAGTAYPEVDFLDAQGEPVDRPYEARTARVSNPGRSDYVVRLVGITWNRPAEGESQQALTVSPVGEPTRLAARSEADVRLAPTDVATYDSVKVFIAVEQRASTSAEDA
ncbi:MULTISPECIES: hypothetical protein [unclassified Aeromicrobium]|jgi:hypothetical protein|uniref:hypothetical protein n=1 Tax=unclassified Aeromicrobium TaxID=2633570 RepID=UPI0007016CE0|nr:MULTISPECIES: hypothetical protein [unclassified Aeromicrobium]KQP82382.1 hypothetical protein ASF35_13285 [Aeromicrobium sp. Leaf291]MCR4512009.1 hypothetical protein [Aeromicrobium sp. 50.2.37]